MLSKISNDFHDISELFSVTLYVAYHDTIKNSQEKINIRKENLKKYLNQFGFISLLALHRTMRKISYIYSANGIITLEDLNTIQKYKQPNIKDINEYFYEGLGNI